MVDWIRSIQGIVITSATIMTGMGIAIRDHIIIGNNAKDIEGFNKTVNKIQKDINKISNQTSEVKGALDTILVWMKKNGRS